MPLGATMARQAKTKKSGGDDLVQARMYAQDVAELKQIALYLSAKYKREVSIAEAHRVACGDARSAFYLKALREMHDEAKKAMVGGSGSG